MNALHVPDNNELSRFFEFAVSPGHGWRTSIAQALCRAYERGFAGCFVDVEDAPDWARKIARQERDRFFLSVDKPRLTDHGPPIAGTGKGKRATHYNLALKLHRQCFTGAQEYGNCVAASLGWAGLNLLSGVQILGMKKPFEFTDVYGTALVYATRRSPGAGMTLSTAARTSTQMGTQTRSLYCDGKYDLRKEDEDEYWGDRWGKTGGPPDDLVAETKRNLVTAVADMGGAGGEAVQDVVYNGGFVHTGSTLTAADNADPVSSLRSIGGHAQTIIGYDDTDECRDWYKNKTGKALNDWFAIFDQTWGPGWITMRNWPTHLWGEYPEGAFVLKGQDAMRLVRSDAYAYSAVKGFGPADIQDWSMI